MDANPNNSGIFLPFSSFPLNIFYQNYRRFFYIVTLFILISLGMCGSARAKFGKAQMRYYAPFSNGVYDPDKLATVEGKIILITTMDSTVTSVIAVPTVALKIKTEKGTYIMVHLAPYWYMATRPFNFKRGQKIKAIGSLMEVEKKKFLVSKKVIVGDYEYVYRDDFGIPVWSDMGFTIEEYEREK